jgi:hypothetical protein
LVQCDNLAQRLLEGVAIDMMLSARILHGVEARNRTAD